MKSRPKFRSKGQAESAEVLQEQVVDRLLRGSERQRFSVGIHSKCIVCKDGQVKA